MGVWGFWGGGGGFWGMEVVEVWDFGGWRWGRGEGGRVGGGKGTWEEVGRVGEGWWVMRDG